MKLPYLLVCLTCILTLNAAAQTRAYSDKNHLRIVADKTTLSIRDSSISLLEENQSPLITTASIVLPPAVDFVSALLGGAATRDAKKYQSGYSASVSSDHFYAEASEAFLPILALKRWVKDRKGNDHLAASIEFQPELSSDKTAFRFVVSDNFLYQYATAKTIGRYDYLQLNVLINVKNLSIQKDEYRIAELRTTTLQIPMVHVGQTRKLSEPVYSGWIPLPTPSTAKAKGSTRDYVRLPGRTGLYEIGITVTETNAYKVRSEDKQVMIKSSADEASNLIKAGIRTTTED
jgi:hypothetical protein